MKKRTFRLNGDANIFVAIDLNDIVYYPISSVYKGSSIYTSAYTKRQARYQLLVRVCRDMAIPQQLAYLEDYDITEIVNDENK